MIYFITIHHESDAFINLQAEYIRKNTSEPYIVYCGVSGLGDSMMADPANITSHKFIDLTEIDNQHWSRLNYLFEVLKNDPEFQIEDNAKLIFLDGDAFPISSTWVSQIDNYLTTHAVAAVHRTENPEPLLPEEYKPYPHPCFFATTVDFWKDNKLEWGLDSLRHIDTAGPTLKIWLEENGYITKQLLRTNCFDLHPLYYGVYGDIIYHHGCGNREVYDSIDIWNRPILAEKHGVSLDLAYPQLLKFNKKVNTLVYHQILTDDQFINYYLRGREQ
jgi:hypothetical protein